MKKFIDYFFIPEEGEEISISDCFFFFGGICTMLLIGLITFLILFK